MENAIEFYVLVNSLKYKIRGGWNIWHISSERLESIAEHVYGTCLLAIAVDSEYKYDIDINKVLIMLLIHEVGEVIIGDITPHDDISNEDKLKIEREAVIKLFSGLNKKDKYIKLFDEFNEHKTKESLFARMIDKMEATIQAKLYDEYSYVDIHSKENEKSYNSDFFKKWNVDTLPKQFYESDKYCYDENFMALGEYIINNDIKSKNIKIDL